MATKFWTTHYSLLTGKKSNFHSKAANSCRCALILRTPSQDRRVCARDTVTQVRQPALSSLKGGNRTSNFRHCRFVEHFELAQLLDERRAAQFQQTRRMRDGAARTIQRLSDQVALDREQVIA
jgi:hypothetical protein